MNNERNLKCYRAIYRAKWTGKLNRLFTLWGAYGSLNARWFNWDTGKCRMCMGVIYEYSWCEGTEYPRLCGKCRYTLRKLLWSHNCESDVEEIPF